MGKPADQSVGFVYPAGGSDRDIGVYKQPEMITVDDTTHEMGQNVSALNISVGNIGKNAFAPVNPYGQKEMRGFGAATKGRKTSGKQG
jgi:hypothetical protein